MIKIIFHTIATIFALVLVSCGGGDSGVQKPSVVYSVNFNPPSASLNYFRNHQSGITVDTTLPNSVVTATFNGLPAETAWPVVTDDNTAFESVVSQRIGNTNSFTLTFNISSNLSDGIHQGNLTLQLFQDQAHTKPYSLNGGVLPYFVTVNPQLKIQIKIDGVATNVTCNTSNTGVMTINGNTIYWLISDRPISIFKLHPGQIITLTANMPVTWHSPDKFYPYNYLWSAPTVTDTTLQQVIASLPNGISGMTGNSYIAMPKTGPQFGAGFVFDIFP